MYNEDEFDDDNDELQNETILIADIEWLPLIDYVPWTDPGFAQDIAARIKGITVESFAKEVDL